MRIALIAYIVLCPVSSLLAREPAFIKPGMSLGDVTAVLEKHDYDVDTRKYGLSIDTDDEDARLDFCRIDSEITLVIEYIDSTKKVSTLSLYFIPIESTTKTQLVARDALRISFEEDNTFTATLLRSTRNTKRTNAAERFDNPFE